jgi:hypothetical protein
VLESDPLGEQGVQRVPEDIVGLDGVGGEHRLQDGGVLQQVPQELLEQVGEARTGEAKSMLVDRLPLLGISDPDEAVEFGPDQPEQLRWWLLLVPGDVEGPGTDIL